MILTTLLSDSDWHECQKEFNSLSISISALLLPAPVAVEHLTGEQLFPVIRKVENNTQAAGCMTRN